MRWVSILAAQHEIEIFDVWRAAEQPTSRTTIGFSSSVRWLTTFGAGYLVWAKDRLSGAAVPGGIAIQTHRAELVGGQAVHRHLNPDQRADHAGNDPSDDQPDYLRARASILGQLKAAGRAERTSCTPSADRVGDRVASTIPSPAC